MNLRQNEQNKSEKNYYQAAWNNTGGGQTRGQSDDIQFNDNMQGGTVVHSNQLSSLVNSNVNNTGIYNTALGSQRGNRGDG